MKLLSDDANVTVSISPVTRRPVVSVNGVGVRHVVGLEMTGSQVVIRLPFDAVLFEPSGGDVHIADLADTVDTVVVATAGRFDELLRASQENAVPLRAKIVINSDPTKHYPRRTYRDDLRPLRLDARPPTDGVGRTAFSDHSEFPRVPRYGTV